MTDKKTGRPRGRPRAKPLTRLQKDEIDTNLEKRGYTGFFYEKNGNRYRLDPKTGKFIPVEAGLFQD